MGRPTLDERREAIQGAKARGRWPRLTRDQALRLLKEAESVLGHLSERLEKEEVLGLPRKQYRFIDESIREEFPPGLAISNWIRWKRYIDEGKIVEEDTSQQSAIDAVTAQCRALLGGIDKSQRALSSWSHYLDQQWVDRIDLQDELRHLNRLVQEHASMCAEFIAKATLPDPETKKLWLPTVGEEGAVFDYIRKFDRLVEEMRVLASTVTPT